MADSIVYEHGSIGQNGQEGFAGSYRLVQSNGQTISASTDFIGNSDIIAFGEDYDEIKFDKPTDIIIKNLDTGKEIIRLPTNSLQIYTRQLEVFMYLPDILFVGFPDTMDYKSPWLNVYKVWQIDLANLVVNKYFELPTVRSIYPVGNQYFIIDPTIGNKHFCIPALAHGKSKVYSWDNLVHLNKLGAPVFQMEPETRLSSINWSSSAIGHFSTCAFVQTQNNSKQIDFLDKAFEPVVSLNIQDLFLNYQPVSFSSKITNSINYITSKTIANNNCLLYWEYKHEILNGSLDICQQSKTIYCWDFTTNAQVYFPSYSKACKVNSIMPFYSSANQVKYFAEELENQKIYGKVYESI